MRGAPASAAAAHLAERTRQEILKAHEGIQADDGMDKTREGIGRLRARYRIMGRNCRFDPLCCARLAPDPGPARPLRGLLADCRPSLWMRAPTGARQGPEKAPGAAFRQLILRVGECVLRRAGSPS